MRSREIYDKLTYFQFISLLVYVYYNLDYDFYYNYYYHYYYYYYYYYCYYLIKTVIHLFHGLRNIIREYRKLLYSLV